ncbi:MAG: hypothetical protein DRN30_04430 [Thermoplasmata archaeon]|nr:MAG: hypothetical protein DRN30_04430 [Thermoplasmata archaeon]
MTENMSMEYFERSKEYFLNDVLPKIKGVFLGFNTNIDALVYLDIEHEFLRSLFKECSKTESKLPEAIRSLNDLRSGLLESISNGKALELIIESEDVQRFIMNNVKAPEYRVGGPPGIVGNILARMGLDIIVHVPSRSKRQVEVLEKEIKIIENGKILPIRAREQDKDLIHWIFEYNKGFSIKYCGKTITAPRENRFIASFDDLNTRLYIEKEYIENINIIGENISHAIISGHHLLTSKVDYKKAIERSNDFINGLKDLGVKIHIEAAYTQDKVIRDIIVKEVFCHANSIGLNEVELALFISTLDKELSRALTTEISFETLVDALELMMEKTGTDRIQFHTYGLYVEVVRRGGLYEKPCKKCLAASSYFATIKALYGDIKDIKTPSLIHSRVKVYTRYKDLIKKLSGFSTGELIFEAIPTIIVEDPKSTVGLGDTISAIGFLCRG